MIEDSKILNWNIVHKYFIRDRLMFSLSASIFRLCWGRCSLLTPAPTPPMVREWGKKRNSGKFLRQVSQLLLYFFVTPHLDWVVPSFLLSTWKKGFLFCFIAGIGLSECFVYVCNKLISLLSKVAKQLINIVVSCYLAHTFLKLAFYFYKLNFTSGNLCRSECHFCKTVFMFLVTSFCLKGKSPLVEMVC